jgi:hypothetical protein
MKLRRADIAFIILIPVVLLCLWLLTTEPTTLRIPMDNEHSESLQAYRAAGKKAAEHVCRSCHGDEGIPLSESHPPEYRCMFCHKPAPGNPAAERGKP